MKHLNYSITPIEKLNYFSDKWSCNVLVKRDDQFNLAGGGSKARMLSYILASNNNYDVLLTAGGPNSNFNRACALMCSKIGKRMHLIEYSDDNKFFDTSLNYKICNYAKIEKTRCRKDEVVSTIEDVLSFYRKSGCKVKYVYGGGRCLEGMFSYYDAINEIYSQNVKVDYLFVACGTGTTLTGISAGLQEYYPNAKVYGISIARTWDVEKTILEDNIIELNNFLGKKYTLNNLIFIDKYLCGGYAQYSETLINRISECVSNEGMLIDPIYSGKAFYGMCEEIERELVHFKNKNIVFWNTGAVYTLASI